MGWLGALGGVGEGLQGYSRILGEKRRNDWANQQAQIQHERQLHMEELRKKSQLEVNKQAQDFTSQESKANREWTEGRDEAGYYQGRKINKADYDALQKDPNYDPEQFTTPEAWARKVKSEDRREDLKHKLYETQEISKVVDSQKMAEMDKQAAAYNKYADENNIPEKERRATLFNFYNPTIAQGMKKAGLSEEEITRRKADAQEVYEYHATEWDSWINSKDLSQAEKKRIAGIKALAAETNDDPKNFYATTMMIGRYPELKPFYQSQAEEDVGISQTLTDSDYKQLAAGVVAGEPKALSSYERLQGSEKERADVFLQKAETGGAASPGVTGSALASTSARPNSPLAYNPQAPAVEEGESEPRGVFKHAANQRQAVADIREGQQRKYLPSSF